MGSMVLFQAAGLRWWRLCGDRGAFVERVSREGGQVGIHGSGFRGIRFRVPSPADQQSLGSKRKVEPFRTKLV